MGSTENLHSEEAIKKIKSLIDSTHICLFTTNLTKVPLTTRPMATLKVDELGIVWFFSKVDSDTNAEIKRDDRVQLLYANTGTSEYLSLYGTAEILTDKRKIDELWIPIAKAWFSEGKEDPTITILKVIPQDGYYWDTKSNKMVQMLKIAVGAIIGKPLDDGLEGKVRI